MYLKGMSGQVKIGQLMSGSIQSVASTCQKFVIWKYGSSLQYRVVSLAALGSSSVALLAKLVFL